MACFTKMCNWDNSAEKEKAKVDPAVRDQAIEAVQAIQIAEGRSKDEARQDAEQIVELIGPEAALEVANNMNQRQAA